MYTFSLPSLFCKFCCLLSDHSPLAAMQSVTALSRVTDLHSAVVHCHCPAGLLLESTLLVS